MRPTNRLKHFIFQYLAQVIIFGCISLAGLYAFHIHPLLGSFTCILGGMAFESIFNNLQNIIRKGV